MAQNNAHFIFGVIKFGDLSGLSTKVSGGGDKFLRLATNTFPGPASVAVSIAKADIEANDATGYPSPLFTGNRFGQNTDRLRWYMTNIKGDNAAYGGYAGGAPHLGVMEFSQPGTQYLNVTTAVDAWIDGSRPNHGFGLWGITVSGEQNENDRIRFSLTHDYDSESDGWLNRARLQVYYQEASINDARLQQFLVPAVVPPMPPLGPSRHVIDDFSSNFFNQDHFGGRVILRGEAESARFTQSLIYGADALRTDTARLRTGIVTNEATGASINSNQISEVTPLKVLPDVTTTRVGMFFRDRIEIDDCPFTITPGVRVNYYRADFATPDPLFDDSNGTPSDVSEWNAQPAIELSAFIIPRLESVVRYARGYRGPPVEDAGIGFINPLFGYTVVPNINLTSETSDSVDFGLSYSEDILAAYVGGYYNHYDDYIDTAALGLDPNTGLIVFQQQNLDAQIYGVEFAGEVRLLGDYYEPPAGRRSRDGRGRDSEARPRQEFYGYSAFANFTHSVGDNLEADIPLDSIPPLYSVVGLRYRALENRWGAEFLSTLVHRKDRYSGAIPDQFIPPGYGVFDLLAYANLSDRLQINAGVFNIFDREYYQWLNIRGVENSQRDRTRFAAPGANFAITVRVHW